MTQVPVPCNLCGADDAETVYEASAGPPPHLPSQYHCTSPDLAFHDRMVRCRRCGLMYASPRDPDAVIQEGYRDVVDETYLEEREGRVLTFTRSLRELERSVRGGSLLDVGAYTGFFLEIAREHGWQVRGVEPSRWAAAWAREKCRLDVAVGTLGEARFPDATFDVVTMWDVIEHMTDPAGELRETARVLKPGGVLALTTIFLDTLPARLLGERYPFIMKMHLTYFTRHTLRVMLERCGLRMFRQHNHVRVIRMHYVPGRVRPYSPRLASIIETLIRRLGWGERPLSVPWSGLKTIYARKV